MVKKPKKPVKMKDTLQSKKQARSKSTEKTNQRIKDRLKGLRND